VQISERKRQESAKEVEKLKMQAREANKADVSVLLTEVKKLKDNPDKIAEVIGLQGSTFSTEAAADLDILFWKIHANNNVEEVLHEFVNTAVDTVQQCTGSLLQGRQSWLIHPRDLSVEYNACISQGAFAKAFKATKYNQVIVVKIFNDQQTLEVSLLNDLSSHFLVLNVILYRASCRRLLFGTTLLTSMFCRFWVRTFMPAHHMLFPHIVQTVMLLII
jgi:hypothetical protein